MPRPLLNSGNLDFSFAGLKTAVRTQVMKLGTNVCEQDKANLAASTQEAIVDVLRINGLVAAVGSQPALERNVPERRLVEAVVAEHCEVVGHTIRDGRFRDRYGAVVLSVARLLGQAIRSIHEETSVSSLFV